MKILDEKGNLFGKINLIDFIVLIIILAFAFFVIYSSVNFSIQKEETYEVVFKSISIDEEIAKTVKKGEAVLDSKRVIGSIESIEISPSKIYSFDKTGTFLVEISNPPFVDLKGKMIVKIKKKHLFYNGNEVKIGSFVSLELENHILKIVILDINKMENLP